MERRSPEPAGLLLAALLSSLMFWSVRGAAAAASTVPPVGVVLDLASGGGRSRLGGRKSLGSISSMAALDDLYVKHPSHARRLGRHVRDVPAAHAGKQIDQGVP